MSETILPILGISARVLATAALLVLAYYDYYAWRYYEAWRQKRDLVSLALKVAVAGGIWL